ncbi:polysaccharide biosynthesis protein [Actinoplanes siamensis]|uniref:UDP-glucose 4-epimerase n=1 Tax=Actinoplanes siamensis TaxID=1223317 RepID=A0A919N3Q1_9ACTN|nr:polysaccharide biosynthesis protein [Actinoplanes siamensis]GIF03796.1 UDP-glucose 4-epimerase [Actinoplanes siamensis]
MLSGRRFAITGGTGSFGQAMVDHLLRSGAAEVRVLSRDEAKQDQMRARLHDDRIRYHIGDVRDLDAVLRVTRGADHVFHAAALKQVPSCEFFPLEALRTNVLGSANTVEACDRNEVGSLVLLSTDKAVHPINAMGMTKALMEKVAQAHARTRPDSATTVCVVRYGNVMYSRGSVVPLFVDQLRRDRPLTVTDPRMTRFLMSLAESVELVERAFADAAPGDVFIRKASACTIGDLAAALGNLFGVTPKLQILGIRHGEKSHETLATREELRHAEDLGEFYRVPLDSRGLDYAPYELAGDPGAEPLFDFNSANARRLAVPEIEDLLRGLPEIRAELSGVMVAA